MTKVNKAHQSEAELLDMGYRKYSGKEMDIFYNKDICEHVGNCTRGNKEVFDVKRRPWILTDNGSVEKNEEVLNTCPTGALKYLLKKKSSLQFIETKNKISVVNSDNAPVGEITWSPAGENIIIIDHTYVDDTFRGQGIASQLVEAAVSYARENNKKVIPLCPFAKREFDLKKEYQDLLN